jgi:putative tryptophan/tyrosine transport system substrate-binding protein
VNRRELIIGLGSAAIAWPLAARAQPKAMPVIGLLSPFSRPDTEAWHQAFRNGLHDLGWVEGVNLKIEYRYADGREENLPELVAELIALKVDLIVVSVATDAVAAAKATKTVPIVMASAGDPVATGLVASLARPGGNVTGLTQISTDLTGKRLELLKEVAPGVSRLAVLWNPADPTAVLTWREIQAPARQLGIDLHSLEVRGSDQVDAAFASVIGAHDNAITALPAPVFVIGEKRIADFAAENHLPSMFHLPEFAHAGGLMSYGPDRADLFRRAATFVDKILKGAKPADLPVEQPTKFQFVLNLRTAKALGLTVSPVVLAQADEVIE